MPNKPKKVQYPWVPERVPFKSFNDNSKFYNSWTWRKVAKAHKLKNPLCEKCKLKGITTSATVTDHIIRLADGGPEYDENNLQSLCSSCHSQKSGKEAHGYKENPLKKQETNKQSIEDVEVIKKRESFYSFYCNKKGWKVGSLSYEQILEIKDQEEWKNPK